MNEIIIGNPVVVEFTFEMDVTSASFVLEVRDEVEGLVQILVKNPVLPADITVVNSKQVNLSLKTVDTLLFDFDSVCVALEATVGSESEERTVIYHITGKTVGAKVSQALESVVGTMTEAQVIAVVNGLEDFVSNNGSRLSVAGTHLVNTFTNFDHTITAADDGTVLRFSGGSVNTLFVPEDSGGLIREGMTFVFVNNKSVDVTVDVEGTGGGFTVSILDGAPVIVPSGETKHITKASNNFNTWLVY